jgi:uncharacterized protein (DUF305 family)
MKNKSVMWGVALIAAGLVLGIATMLVWGGGMWAGPATGFPGGGEWATGSVERHFLEEMIPHHEDAVAMAQLALARAEHPELKQLAGTIERDQTREIEQMRTWYRSWYGVDAPAAEAETGRRGGWMMGGMMHDDTDIAALEAAAEFDKEFIEQMIPHHQMAVMMANMLLARSDRPEMQDLARAIIETQTAEVEQMADWYESWYE